MLINKKVIILRALKFGEADLIIHAIDQQGGKNNFIAKSALKSKKRFGGGVLEPLNYIVASFKLNSDPDKLHILNEAKVIEGFSGLRSDYDRLELGLYFLKVIDKVAIAGDSHSSDCFNLLGHSLKLAQSTSQLDYLRFLFELKLLQYQGVLENQDAYAHYLSQPITNCDSENIQLKEVEQLHRPVQQLLNEWLGSANSRNYLFRRN